MEHLCVLQLETALATLVTTWFTLPTVDEGLDTAALTSSDPKFISLTTIQVGKRIKDIKERAFGSAS
jgi:hypothetical protein